MTKSSVMRHSSKLARCLHLPEDKLQKDLELVPQQLGKNGTGAERDGRCHQS
jgi:hypothetical protein